VLDFKIRSNQYLTTVLKERFNSQTIIQNKDDLQIITKEKNIKNIILPYLTTGYENDFITEIKKRLRFSILPEITISFVGSFQLKVF